jgi:hypothetical protein
MGHGVARGLAGSGELFGRGMILKILADGSGADASMEESHNLDGAVDVPG